MLNFVFVCLFTLSFSAVSQVSFLQPLNFGTIVASGNERVSTLELRPNGRSSSTNDIHIIEAGKPAQILVENFPPRTQLIISDSVNNTRLTRSSGGRSFILNKLLYRREVVTNGLGIAEVDIGGVISTSGSGGTYFDDKFKSIIQITIEY